MDELGQMIQKLLEAKDGDKEFFLHFIDVEWRAAIGNKSPHVTLTEAIEYGHGNADFFAMGNTAIEAVQKLYDEVSHYKRE